MFYFMFFTFLISAFVRQTQVNKNFTQKESDQSIRIILSKRLGEYRQGEHILKPIKKAT